MDDIEITNITALWSWLDQNYGQRESVRLITWKAAHPTKYVSRQDVLDALIAYGWIDGRRFVVDANRTGQLIAPRQQQAWAQSYKVRAEKLRSEGRMHSAGEACVAAGKASGLWDFFADVDALILPDDLAKVVERPRWDALAPSYRRNVLRWIKMAKTETTRSKRIAAAADATAAGRKIPQM